LTLLSPFFYHGQSRFERPLMPDRRGRILTMTFEVLSRPVFLTVAVIVTASPSCGMDLDKVRDDIEMFGRMFANA
jgi:hypothetical protein